MLDTHFGKWADFRRLSQARNAVLCSVDSWAKKRLAARVFRVWREMARQTWREKSQVCVSCVAVWHFACLCAGSSRLHVPTFSRISNGQRRIAVAFYRLQLQSRVLRGWRQLAVWHNHLRRHQSQVLGVPQAMLMVRRWLCCTQLLG